MSRNEQIMTEELARAIKLEPEDINDFKKVIFEDIIKIN